MTVSRLLPATQRLVAEALGVYFTLLKILVPALVIVKGLQMLGAVEWLGAVLSPLMGWLGLPDVMGVVWAATLLTNIFTGLVVLFEVAGDTPLTVVQATVLGSLLLVGHSLPVEGAVARRAGVPWSVTVLLRVGGALLLGALIHYGYGLGGWGEQTARLIWRPEPGPDTLSAWAWAQLQTLAMIFVIIFLLLVLLRLLRYLRLERLIHLALTPLLRLLGIGRAAANVTVIGFMLGLSYGAGLVIRDVDAGVMNRRDSFLALCFLGLCHSVIEDTLLILLLGADVIGVLWVRIVFAVIVIALLSRLARGRLDTCAPTP
ncbi:MAG TPA: nucleoside recognition domain-containing protein [Halomonas sp.]|nr:nucleoside recognition domain-containing protein [Halomonas sp.]